MPLETFQQELDELVADVIDLGTEVACSLESTVEAMMSRDAEVVEAEPGVDARYKARGAQIGRACMIMQARRALVARDFRVLYSAQSVTNHLARSGALIEHMCHAIFETAKYEKDEELEAILDPKRGSLSYANAGHDLPYLRRRGGGCEELRARGMPLGLMLGMDYEQKEIVLDTGRRN